MDKNVLEELYKIIRQRKEELPEDSYTTTLFKTGENKILKKLGEELVEIVQGCVKNNKEEIVYESVDLIYHLMVAWAYYDIDFEDILKEVERRRK